MKNIDQQKENPEIQPLKIIPVVPVTPEINPSPEKKEPFHPSPEIPAPKPELIPGKEKP